ncbi:MAG: glycosyltransferase family 2 protein [Planctomycetota bacterium]
MSLISIVIPVYKNRETLAEACRQIREVHTHSFPQHQIEIIFIDDGSPDGSWTELERIRAEYPTCVNLVKLSRNFGQLSAMLAGYDTARGDAVIYISADLQDPVNLMADMVAHWEKGNELVIAFRERREDSQVAQLFSRIAYTFADNSNRRMPKGGFDYLLMGRKSVDLMKTFKGQHRFFQGDVLWMGFPTAFLPYVRRKRLHGKSGYTFMKKVKSFLDLMLDSSFLPIRMMSALGFLTASAGMLYALSIVIAYFFRGQMPFAGWAPIMIAILVIGGLIMMMLGVIGEYLWRIYDDIKGKPMYVIEKHVVIAATQADPPGSDR